MGGSSTQSKKQVWMDKIRQDAALEQARALIEKVNDNCFDKCVPKPGKELSKGETTCINLCMEKYMSAWNVVSRKYIERIQSRDAI
ncbi:mitochondrial import inner membrane translocase subunit tim13 [Drechslerella stenobrocha 248]|uniref:Mitochondrial import inner membrane translocase subunit n=1 Tax=Drechslerella stenobrocha 248 TaxID=1043628 RepID=W7HVR5_9PEZI|nr:mitochondrial import inner membrane translocase subunit tim13 [Drechslerella stenobrocha 248]